MNRITIQFAFFILLFFGITSFFYLCYNKICINSNSTQEMSNQTTQDLILIDTNKYSNVNLVDSLIFISDTHNNSEVYFKIRNLISDSKPSLIVHAGDLTDFGTLEELSKAKEDLDVLKVRSLVLPGDHDIAETSSLTNFNRFFSLPNTFYNSDYKILFIPNFYNFTLLDSENFSNILKHIPESDIIVSSQPVFVYDSSIFSNKYMGSLDAFENANIFQKETLKKYNLQRLEILKKIRETKKPKLVISGDHHRSDTFNDPVNELVKYHILGALSKNIYMGNTKLSQSSLQSQRFTIIQISRESNKSLNFNIVEVEVK